MKLWEVIKELTDDPTKIFEISDRGSRERIGSDGNYLWYERLDHGMISNSPLRAVSVDINDNNWQIVKQPITWQEAIQAWAEGKEISYKYPGDETMYQFRDSNRMLSVEKIKDATWYVEDYDGH